MRKLNLTDVFRFSRLVKTSGMRDVVANTLHAVAEAKARAKADAKDGEPVGNAAKVGDSDLYAIGIDAFMSIVDMAAQKGVEASVYEFLAPVWEMTTEQVSNMSLEAVAENLRRMFAENDFSVFFKRSEALTD